MKPLIITKERDYRGIETLFQRQEIQAYTMAILSFFALAFFFVFAIRPTLISFFNLQKQISDSRMVEEKLDAKINALLKAQEQYQLLSSDITMMEEVIPPDPKFPELVQRIESLIVEQEATMTAFTTTEFSLLKEQNRGEAKIKDLSTINFDVTFEPAYDINKSVLARLLNLRRMINISSMIIDSETNGATEGQSTIETEITASAYYQSLGDEK